MEHNTPPEDSDVSEADITTDDTGRVWAYFGHRYGTSLELDELDDATEGIVSIETQGFSEVNGAQPASYHMDEDEVAGLIQHLLVILEEQHDDVDTNIESESCQTT